jgi:hypothetical protein
VRRLKERRENYGAGFFAPLNGDDHSGLRLRPPPVGEMEPVYSAHAASRLSFARYARQSERQPAEAADGTAKVGLAEGRASP